MGCANGQVIHGLCPGLRRGPLQELSVEFQSQFGDEASGTTYWQCTVWLATEDSVKPPINCREHLALADDEVEEASGLWLLRLALCLRVPFAMPCRHDS